MRAFARGYTHGTMLEQKSKNSKLFLYDIFVLAACVIRLSCNKNITQRLFLLPSS